MTTASATRAHLPTRVPCIIAGAGRAANGYEYTVESLHDLLRHLTLNPKVFKGRGDVRETARRGHRSLAELAGILVKESLQYRPMEQNLVGELVLHPAMARVLESAAEDGDDVRLEVEGTPELVPGTKRVRGWRHISSVNLLAPESLGWCDRVREADSPVDHAALKEWNREMDQRLYDNAPALGVEHVVYFVNGEARESVQRRGYLDLAAAGEIPGPRPDGPLARPKGAPSTGRSVREVREAASTGPLPSRSSTAPQSTPSSVQQALAAANAGTGLMLSEDNINLRERASQHYPDNYAVKSDADVAVHESVASGVWDYNLDATLGERARQPLETASVRETSTGQRSASGYVNPLDPGGPQLRQALDVANRGVAEGIFKRPAAPPQSGTPGSTTEDLVSQALFGGR